MTLIVKTKNKNEEKIIKAFLSSLEIGFHSEEEEDKALYNAMKKGKKTPLLNSDEKKEFLMSLKKEN